LTVIELVTIAPSVVTGMAVVGIAVGIFVVGIAVVGIAVVGIMVVVGGAWVVKLSRSLTQLPDVQHPRKQCGS